MELQPQPPNILSRRASSKGAPEAVVLVNRELVAIVEVGVRVHSQRHALLTRQAPLLSGNPAYLQRDKNAPGPWFVFWWSSSFAYPKMKTREDACAFNGTQSFANYKATQNIPPALQKRSLAELGFTGPGRSRLRSLNYHRVPPVVRSPRVSRVHRREACVHVCWFFAYVVRVLFIFFPNLRPVSYTHLTLPTIYSV